MSFRLLISYNSSVHRFDTLLNRAVLASVCPFPFCICSTMLVRPVSKLVILSKLTHTHTHTHMYICIYIYIYIYVSYLYNGNHHTRKEDLYIQTVLWALHSCSNLHTVHPNKYAHNLHLVVVCVVRYSSDVHKYRGYPAKRALSAMHKHGG